MVAELDALSAVGKGHYALAFCFGNRENVLENACSALAKAAAPAKRG